MSQPKLQLSSANTDNLSGRTLAAFTGSAGNMLSINCTLSLAGKDLAKSTRAALLQILRQTADELEAVDKAAGAD